MRHFIPLFLGASAMVAAPFARAASATPEALRDAVREAFEARSVSAWKENVELGALTPNETDILDQTLTRIFSVKPTVDSLEVAALPEDFDQVLVGSGKRYALTLKAEGVLRLAFRTGPKGQNVILLPYGKVAGGYKLGTLHGERLVWKGPDDRAFYVKVKHTGSPDDVSIVVKYNASGVDIVKRVGGKTPFITVPAQFIDSVEVVRKEGSAGETSLDISCQGTGDSNEVKPIYASPKLAKAGTIVFVRKDAVTNAAK